MIRCHEGIFALLRSSIDSSNRVLCLHNFTNGSLDVSVDLHASSVAPANNLVDLLSGEISTFERNRIELSLGPYQFRWLQVE